MKERDKTPREVLSAMWNDGLHNLVVVFKVALVLVAVEVLFRLVTAFIAWGQRVGQ